MVSVGRISHIPVVTPTWEDLPNLARQAAWRDWYVLTRSVGSGKAEHAPALQPATCSLTADKRQNFQIF